MTGGYILVYVNHLGWVLIGHHHHDLTDTLSSMLLPTSTFIPGAFFTSLPGVRVEHLSDAMRVCIPFHSPLYPHPTSIVGHRSKLKAHLRYRHLDCISEPLCVPLRAFTGRPASAAEAAVLDDAFRTACVRDLLASYRIAALPVLVQHARECVEDAYSAFRLAARQLGTRAGAGQNE